MIADHVKAKPVGGCSDCAALLGTTLLCRRHRHQMGPPEQCECAKCKRLSVSKQTIEPNAEGDAR